MLRFAPSPSGQLHAGNARIAVLNWLRARQTGSEFLLRFDDTDAERSTRALSDCIEFDLRWLGLDWDKLERQSERAQHYEQARARLVAGERLYRCYETPDELAAMRRSARLRGRPFVYDRRGLELSDTEHRQLESEGRKPYWRFRLSSGTVAWEDMAAGEKSFTMELLSDPVVVRADGRPLYLLASSVDDIEMGVREIVRGEDHITNTAAQIDMIRALGGREPRFAHIPLVRAEEGEGLSKRKGDDSEWSLSALRDGRGFESLAVVAYLARVGTGVPMESVSDIRDLVEGFDLGAHGGGAPRLDRLTLARMSARALHTLNWERARARLEEEGIDGVDESLWQLVSGNLETIGEVRHWRDLATGDAPIFTLEAEEKDLARLALATLATLSEVSWSEGSEGNEGDKESDTFIFKEWRRLLEKESGKSGRALLVPFRYLLTGLNKGPELGAVIAYLGAERVASRLESLLKG
ncbi:MAG: glutamate--tRNA ligase family protein [Alphaproteobacteria bacterium]